METREASHVLAEERARLLQQLLAEAGLAGTADSIGQRPAAAGRPLSRAQQRLWFIDQLVPGHVYNVPALFRLPAGAGRAAVTAALERLAARQEVLRTSYPSTGGAPVAELRSRAPVNLRLFDFSGLPAAERRGALSRLAARRARRPLRLATGPVFRACLVRLGPDDLRLLLVIHHIACDWWSLEVIAAELTALLAGQQPPALPIQYADFAAWQQERLGEATAGEQLEYWCRNLAGAPVLELTGDRPRPPVRSYAGRRHRFELPAATGAGLERLARELATTPFVCQLAAFHVLLARWTGQNDIVVGTPVSGRSRAELEPLVGLFINTLPVRVDLSADPTFADVVSLVKSAVAEMFAHAEVPFEAIVDALNVPRDLSRTPVFQTLFSSFEMPAGQDGDDLSGGQAVALAEDEIDFGIARFDLSLLTVRSARGMAGVLEYSTDLLQPETAASLGRGYATLLEQALARPAARVSELPLLSLRERRQVVHGWNETAAELGGPRTLTDLFEAQAARTPSRTAVAANRQQLSYGRLDMLANRLARALRERGVGRGSVVGVCAERSLELAVALMAVLKAGAAYLPLEPEYPADRLAYMVEDSRAALVLVQRHLKDRLGLAEERMLEIDSAAAGRGTARRCPPADPRDLAYVIYTSGSTGRPKGVLTEHAAIANRLLWMQAAFPLGARDRILQKTPISFDVSVWELFWPLLVGARLTFARPQGHRDTAYLAEVIERERITTCHFVPSMLAVFLDQPGITRLSSLRRVICSGEELPPALQRCFFSRIGCELHNLYGPTEAAVDVTHWPCGSMDRGSRVPIGRPISNVRVYVVDDWLEPVPTGGAGELVIGGAAVARGYLGRPGLTAQRFVPDPFGPPGARAYRTGDLCRRRADGAVEFLGRLDTQVKLHGNRIELGEIETALAAHPGVRQCCVILRQLDAGPALVAYLVPGTAAWTPAELRDHLLRSLPPATVPSHYVAIEALPLSPNGKLDRSALPAPGPAPVRRHVEPRIRREEVLAAVWAAVLGAERVGIHDNFFALGGDSMKAVRAVGLARERGVEISVEYVFRHQTVAELAAAAAASTARPRIPEAFELLGQEDGQRTPEDAEDAYPMTMLQAGMLLHMHEGEEIPAYHNVTTMCVSARFDSRAMRQAADRLVKRHAALRTSLHVTGFSVPMAVVHRRCRLPVTYEDLRGLEPGEQQAAVTSFMQLQARQPLDVTRAPLLRLHAHVISDDAFWVTVTECHPILDGWSFTSSIRELLVGYSAFLDGTEPDAEPASPPYQREFVRREREAMASPAEEEFWNERLRGARPQCLPRWPAPAHAEPESHRLYHLILGDLIDGLERLARETAVPLSSVLLAAHLRVLSLICGGPDVVTGVTVHGRPEVADADAARGLFLNVLPLRCRLDGGTWRELISQAFAGQGELYAHRHYPQAAVQRLWSREHGRSAMFEAGFNYTHFYSMAELGQLSNVELASAFREIARTNVPLAANFDRSLDEDGAGVVMSLESEAGVIGVEQLRRFAELYEAVLRAMAADPDARYEAVEVLGATDAAETAAANLTPAPLPALAAHRMIEEQARSTPALPAVRDRARTLSYRELEAAAAALAARIRERGCGRGAGAGICVGRGVQMAIAVLATLKAGVTYLPLDPALPRKRLERLAARAGAALVLCDRQTLPALAGMAAARLMVEGQGEGRLDAGYDWRPDELVYVIYTSGSTGEPKGVAVTQGGLANYLAWAARAYEVREGDRVPVQTQLGFDLTVTSLLVPLVAGGCAEILENVEDLGAALAGGPWSLLKLTPSHLRLLEVAAGELKPGAARLLVVGGESLHGEALQAWRRADPGVQIINEYGPTETVVGCCVHRVPAGALGPVPIGRPIANTQLHVLDGDLLPAPVGTMGELFVGGAGVARGYLGQPGRTGERFMPDPYSGQPGARMYRTGDLVRRLPGGDLEFLDRVDDQVKISGHRVEPAETEAALCEHDAIAAAAVVPFTTATGTRLAAFMVPAGSARAPAKQLRDHLSERLPAPMIPALFAWLDRLPLTANAKLDRAALVRQAAGGEKATPEPAAGLASGPTDDPLVAKITAAWTEVLGPAAGSDADFFELGGDSIAALQIVARLLAGGVQLRPSAIFENPTPRELATSLGMPAAGAPAQPGAASLQGRD